MNAFAVVFVSFITSVATAAGTVYAIDRYDLLAQKAPPPKQQGVPSLIGLTEADARTNLDAIGLKLMVAGREPTSGAEPGTVVRQAPVPGQLLEVGQAVNLTIALALPTVPELTGRPLAEAKRLAEEAGYTVEVGEPVASDDVVKDSIVTQDPKAGAPLAKKGVVKLQPSSGTAAVALPKLVGMSLNNAKAAAEKAGLKFAVQWVALAETATYVVLRQTPDAGATVAPGSEVKVVVNR